MKPVQTEETNVILNKPENWNEEEHGQCIGLPVCKNGVIFQSYWQLSFIERIKVLFGKKVTLTIISEIGHPPVSMDLF